MFNCALTAKMSTVETMPMISSAIAWECRPGFFKFIAPMMTPTRPIHGIMLTISNETKVPV